MANLTGNMVGYPNTSSNSCAVMQVVGTVETTLYDTYVEISLSKSLILAATGLYIWEDDVGGTGKTEVAMNGTYNWNIGTYSGTFDWEAWVSGDSGSQWTYKGGTHLPHTTVIGFSRLKANQTIRIGISSNAFAGWQNHNLGSSTATRQLTIPARPSYKVTYDANGGSGAPSQQTKWVNEDLTLSSTIPTRSGYTFVKWNTKADGSGSNYNSGVIYQSNEPLALYAVWHKNPTLKSYSVNSSGTYYKGASGKQYSVTIGAPILYDNATVSSIVLSIGAAGSASRTTAGTLLITPQETGTYTPTIKITDSTGASTTYTLGSITVKENTKPTCTVTVTSSANYYGGYSNYSVNIDNVTVYNDKTVSSIVLTVSNSSWTKTASRTNAGGLSVALNEVSTNTTTTVKVVITDNIGASTQYNLSSITVYPNTAPSATYTTSSGSYYGGVSSYTVNVTASATAPKVVTQIKLTVGSLTPVTRTTNGSLSVALPAVSSNTNYSVTLEVTDTTGTKFTKSLGSITVYPNTPPSYSYTTNTGNFYKNLTAKPYEVSISNATGTNGKTISEAKLILGSQTKSTSTITNGAASLSIVPNTAGTITPQIIVTDNKGASTTKNATSITVFNNDAPTATCSVRSSAPYYDTSNVSTTTAKTPYVVELNNIVIKDGKTLKNITLTLGSQSVSTNTITNGTAELSIDPSTPSNGLTATVTITDKIDNDATGATQTYTLPTNVVVNARTLSASEVSARRIDSNGKLSNTGTNCLVQTKINYSKYGQNYLKQPTLKVKEGNTAYSAVVTWYTSWNNTSGFSSAVNWSNYTPNSGVVLYGKVTGYTKNSTTQTFDANNSYVLTLTPNSVAGATNNVSTVSFTLGQAFYLIAAKAGGHALGIGKKPSADGQLDVGMAKIIMNNYDSQAPCISYRKADSTIVDMIVLKDNNLYVGTSTQSSKPTASIGIHDLQTYKIIPNIFDKGVNFFFSNNNTTYNTMPTDNWWSGIHINGWSGDYNAWELVGPSGSSDQRTTPLYVRSGRTTNGWGSWRKIYDSSNPPAIIDTTGTLPINRGGTGQTTAGAAASALIAGLGAATADAVDNMYIICGNAGSDNNTYYKRETSKLWNYIKTKLSNGSYDKAYYILKDSTIDLTQANNGVTANTERYFGVRDKNNNLFGLFEAIAKSNGDTAVTMTVRNETSGDSPTFTGWTGFSINKTKANSVSFSLGCSGTISGNVTVTGTLKANNLLTLYREGTTANNYPAGIKFSVKDTTTNQTYSSAYIYAYQDHGSTTYGTNMVIHSGGGMFIGSGESPANHYSAKGASYNGEDTFITADETMYIQSTGNTIANRVGFYIDTSHQIVPCKADTATNNIGSIGTSSYKWANLYVTNINGVAVGTSPKFTDSTISTLTLASDTGTSAITLAHGGKYKLTAGTKTVIFTMPSNPADYITEQGTSGIWRYRKWNSGVSECWALQAKSFTMTSGYGTDQYYTTGSETFPSGLFKSNTQPIVTATRQGQDTSGLVTISVYGVTNTTMTYYVFNSGVVYSPANIGLSIHAYGLWK